MFKRSARTAGPGPANRGPRGPAFRILLYAQLHEARLKVPNIWKRVSCYDVTRGFTYCEWGQRMPIARKKAFRRSGVGHESIAGTLSGPLLQFDLARELDQLHKDESWLHTTGRSSKTLVKHPDLRIVLIAMKANTRMHEHTAAGRISVHSLNGHIRLHLPDRVVDLPAGHLLALDRCVPHDVEAAEDTVFLLTLSWPPKTKIVETKTHRKKTARNKRK